MIIVRKNEATPARRRVYFHLVSGTDGMTPATSEAAGQPQISVDGAAFTNTGIGTLSAIGNGRYYAELTQAVVNVDDAIIETRYKSANTAECPGSTVQVLAEVATVASIAADIAAFATDEEVATAIWADASGVAVILARKLLTNKTVEATVAGVTTVTLYDDDNVTSLGTLTYTDATATRTKLA